MNASAVRESVLRWLRARIAPSNPRLRMGILIGLLAAGFLGLLALPGLHGLDIEVSKPSPRTIKASRTIEYIDRARTEELREVRASQVQKIYRFNAVAEAEAEDDLHTVFGVLAEVVSEGDDIADRAQQLTERLGDRLDPSAIEAAATLKPQEVSAAEAASVRFLLQRYGEGVHDDLLADEKEAVRVGSVSGISPAARLLVTQVTAASLKPNWRLDRQETERLRGKAAQEVAPITQVRMAGEKIVGEGEIVTREQAQALEQLGLLNRDFSLSRVLGVFSFIVAGFLLVGAYVRRYHAKVASNPRLVLLLGLIILLAIGLAVLARALAPQQAAFIVVTPLVGILAAILFGGELAVVAVLIAGLTAGLVDQSAEGVVFALLLGFFAVYASSRVEDRRGLARTGASIALVGSALAWTVSLALDYTLGAALINAVVGLSGAAASAVLAVGLLPFLESAFEVTTDLQLLELSNPNHPLLKDLMLKAPGTWNHSVVASNLAAAAAEAIGANALLARAGAYFHDVGKMRRPFFFIENNYNQAEGHDKINPHLSCLVITSHVREGVELARDHRLPIEVVAMIEEHHGTSLVSYFFHRAKEGIVKEDVCEDSFRYPGRVPQSKESALVMLADSVEAAARTVTKPALGRFEQLCRKITDAKLADGQLDESRLTLTDLRRSEKAFAQALSGIYHSRIEYPEQGEAAVEPLRGPAASDGTLRSGTAPAGRPRPREGADV